MTTEQPSRELRTDLAELPTFRLSCTVDDEEDPSRVTVFSDAGDDFYFTWISIDADSAVDLDEIA